jgi:hypothetical protein
MAAIGMLDRMIWAAELDEDAAQMVRELADRDVDAAGRLVLAQVEDKLALARRFYSFDSLRAVAGTKRAKRKR